MQDLKEIYERLEKLYETEREEMPVLDEFILEYRWFMCADTRGRVSQCLRVGKEKSPEAYQAVLSKELGKPVDLVIKTFLESGDETLREPLVALLQSDSQSRELCASRDCSFPMMFPARKSVL